MAKWNEKLKEIKSSADETVQRIKGNESVANVTEKLNQNEQISRFKNSKYFKYSVVLIAAILIVGVFSVIFGGQAKIAEEALSKNVLVGFKAASGYSNVKFESELVAKNSGDDLYLFDTTLSYTRAEEDCEEKRFYIVYSVGDNGAPVRSFSYDDDEKLEVKKRALQALKEGQGKPSTVK